MLKGGGLLYTRRNELKKTFLSIILVFSVLVFISPQSTYASAGSTYILSFQSEIDEKTILDSGATIIKTLKHQPIAIIEATEASISKLQDADNIIVIEKDEELEIAAQRVSWGVKPIQIPSAWQTGYTGKGIKVAVIDTGIGPHDDLNVVERISFVRSEPSTGDLNGHGTHIAGIIAALDNNIGVKGIAPDAELYSLKVFNKEGKGYTQDVLAAIDWAIEHQIDIINLSLTSEAAVSSYEDLVNHAYQKGILIIGAAGNSIETDVKIDNVKYPARYTNVIAVSSVDSKGNKGYFSSIGPAVEVTAPGVNIYSTYVNNSYDILQGTSLATAFVTGHLALLKEAYPNLNNTQLRKIMVDTSFDLGPSGRDPVFGYGLIQAAPYTLPLYEFPATKNPATALTFSVDDVQGAAGETVKVNIIARFKNGESIDVSSFAKWTFENPKIAASRSGRIDLFQEGETMARVTYGGLSARIDVQVNPNSTPYPHEEFPFTDVSQDHWAVPAIQEIYRKQIITGYEDGTFRPSNAIQRQHVAAMIGRTLQLEKKTAFKPFTDVKMDSPYYYDIMKTQQAKIFSGNEKGFEPQKSLTRAQMAKIIVEAFNLPKASSHPFTDVPNGHWSNEYIASLYAAGITTGSDGKYNPNDPVTRTHFTVFLSRALNQ